ncbi:MAG: exodeoxyribonuclease VII small subunit [Lachnospiraceae bacterium]
MEDIKLEELFAALDNVVKELEDDKLSLEDTFASYHKGIDFIKACNDKIETIEKQVILLDENGENHEF